MSKKDYIAIATIISETAPATHHGASETDYQKGWDAGCNAARYRIAEKMADHFAAENPRFDRSKFMQACGFSMECELVTQ